MTDFYEEDESADEINAIFDRGPVGVTELPPTIAAAGDPRDKPATWTLMPVNTSNGECSQCGVLHHPDEPHNLQSLYYQYAFRAEHDRWPTWVDAMEHCTPETRSLWTEALRERGVDL